MFGCGVEPQHVVTGKPNCGFVYPGGVGAGVVCRVASLVARDIPECCCCCFWVSAVDDDESERDDISRKSVTRKAFPSSDTPVAREAGQREGTTAWMAFREACSPRNISSAAFPGADFMNKCFWVLLGRVVVILAVELKPLLLWVETVVVAGLRERVRTMDGSSFMVVIMYWELQLFFRGCGG